MAPAHHLGKPCQVRWYLKRGNHLFAEEELRYRAIPGKEHPQARHKLAEIHLAKISKLDRGEQLTDELPALQTDDQAA